MIPLTFVAGSSWGPDEDIFIKYFNEHPEMKLVIAPHVVSDSHLKEILDKVKRPCIRYTEATEENVTQADLFDYRLLRTAVLHLPIW